MSIYGALFSGVSGLAAQSNALGMISDNISNVNTVAYKGTKARFSTLVTQAATRTAYTPGGVRSAPLAQVDQQGLLQSSESKTDLAIAGRGLFVVNEAAEPGAGNEFMFTRAGQFRPDKNGNLVNAAGYYLQGWKLDDQGSLPAGSQSTSSLSTVNIFGLSGQPQATSNISLGLNLPSTASDGESHGATVQIFDSLGNAHNLDVSFTYDEANTRWDIGVADPVLAADPTQTSGTVAAAARSITFGGDGTPQTIDADPIEIAWDDAVTTADDASAADGTAIALDLGTVGQSDGLTQFAGDFSVNALDQNGLRVGNFTGVNVDQEGTVTAVFDNGQSRGIYRLPLAVFNNPNGLEARDGNAYLQTDRSGPLLMSSANTGGAGRIEPSALEASTVDLAEEFTDMITTQRAYTASARIITTSDEMLEELMRTIR